MPAPTIEQNPDIDPADPERDFIESTAAKFEKADEEREREEAGEEDDEGDDTADDGNDSDDDDSGDEPADSDQADDDRDGDTDDSDEDSSDEADDDEPTEEEDSEDSDDDADADDDEDETDDDEEEGDGEDEEDDDGEVTEDFADAARRSNIPITLDDIPEGKPRQLVARRLREMESGFTRMAQKLNAYRKDEVAFKAEEKYRKDNPEIAIVEAIQNLDDATWNKVSERLAKLGDPDAKELFKELVESRRGKAAKAVEEEVTSGDRIAMRVAHVEGLTARLASKAGLPWSYAEEAIERAILRLPEGKRDLTDDDIAHVVTEAARRYEIHVRGERRGQSKRRVQERTASRRAASRPGARTPSGAASPRPGGEKTPKVNYSDEDSRQAAMMRTARKLFKGARDH